MRTGIRSLELYAEPNVQAVVALPQFEQEISSLKLSFWSYSGDANLVLSVGYMTDLDDPATFVAVSNHNSQDFTAYRKRTVTFGDAPDGSYIAFRLITTNNYDNYWYLDDIEVAL